MQEQFDLNKKSVPVDGHDENLANDLKSLREKDPKLEELFTTDEKKQQMLLNLETDVVNFNNGHQDVPNCKEIHLKLDGKSIGELIFTENLNEETLEINEVFLREYHGLGIGMKLYDKLISYAKENHFTKIESDISVRGGALVAWIKLVEKYKVIINSNTEDFQEEKVDFKEVIQKYKDKKLPKDYGLATSTSESVFELIIE